jgi:D-arabinose 1-dehydrogenase-like Zn-dependent alcohol dehydrogenase
VADAMEPVGQHVDQEAADELVGVTRGAGRAFGIVSRKGRRGERRCEVARVFITGSSDGLGLMAARLLIDQGHEVVLHGRNEGRSERAARIGGARAEREDPKLVGAFNGSRVISLNFTVRG